MKEKIIGIIILGIILQSCVTNKYLSSETPMNQVTNIEYFEPYSYIQFIKKGNKSELNDSLSLESKRRIDSVIYSNKNLYKIKKKIIIMNSSINEKVENELSFLIQSAMQKRKLEGIELTPIIDSILESRNQRFGLGIVAVGFGRKKGNFVGQVAKGVKRNKKYKLWCDGFHPVLLDTYKKWELRVNYIHYNPVDAQFVYHERDWKNSSYAAYEEGNLEQTNIKVTPLW